VGPKKRRGLALAHTAADTQKTKARNETPQMGLKMHAAQHNK